MKEGIVLVLLCVLVLGGAVWYFMPGAAHDLFSPAAVVVKPQEPPPQKDHVPTRPVHEPKAHGSAVVHSSKVMTVIPAEPAAEADRMPAVEAIRTVVKPAPFPAAKDVAIGVGISDVVDEFGVPALSAETQHRGHYLQMFVYRTEGAQAIIHFMDGKVSRAYFKK
jgi:hypothetical protein